MCLSPLYNVLDTVPEIFPFFFRLCHVIPYAWCTWLHLPYLAMCLILWHYNQVMTVISFLFGNIWKIYRRWLTSTLVFYYIPH